MRVTVVGGGNIGTQLAAHCAEKGHDVVVYTSTPEVFGRRLTIVDEDGRVTHEGDIRLATRDPEAAFRTAELILVTLPPNLLRGAAETIGAHAGADAAIGVIPGNGGGECAFARSIARGNTFFGIERVPAIARLVEKGRTVRSVGYRAEMHVAALPAMHAPACAGLIEGILDIPCRVIPNYLALTMTPSNPILHTARLRTIFADWRPGKTYDALPLFYEEWDDASSARLIACDEEVQMICRALPDMQLDDFESLRAHYESWTPEEMTRKLCSIRAFKGLPTPAVECGGKWMPDLHSRYFTADFSYGLAIIRQIAGFAGVATPAIDDTLGWYARIALEKQTFCYADYGIEDRASFDRFYLR